ncbi:MAG: ATPase [Methanobrevibacter sp.]|uniref:ATPase n=1 Tax=Methanobrevibacter TaxID=2172 RepID=UPI0025EDAF0E|nr:MULTISPECIES: ATPase [Methanobrevibacter]MBS7257584.1 ATPase [Methanobrevibacter sp.]MCI7428788.1 ATPase [Methanobrevibacter sp.]MDD6776453.1 ATPase [Methanobacteriaceae archaeon]MDY3097677.1 ATPase [Methanobrevibacter sp.]
MDLMFDVSGLNEEKKEFSNSKKDVLKFLKIIGVDSRFVSYTPDKLYINNLRFSKFSRKRQDTFNKQYPEIEVVRSSLFQKICSKSSKHLALEIQPNSTLLMPKDNFIIELLMEPYTRKYGVKLVYDGDADFIVNPLILDDQVNDIFEGIFDGVGLNRDIKSNEVYPLINVPLDWINSFLEMDGQKLIENKNKNELATSFSEFLEDVAPQYKENVVKAAEFIEKKLSQ